MKLLFSRETVHVESRLHVMSTAPTPPPLLLLKSVLRMITAQVVDLCPFKQLTANGGTGDGSLVPMTAPLLVNELLVTARLPEKACVASMQDAACAAESA